MRDEKGFDEIENNLINNAYADDDLLEFKLEKEAKEDEDDLDGLDMIDINSFDGLEKKPENKDSKRNEKNPSLAQKKKKRFSRGTIEIVLVSLAFIIPFGFMIRHFKNFIDNESSEFIYNSYNARFGTYSDKIVRGDILSADGKVIATTVNENGTESRSYPYSELFSHIVGYVSEGMSGLEAQYSFDLLKTHVSLKEVYENDLNGEKCQGDSMITTLDYDTQLAAHENMNGFRGAVVAIEPSTGKIVAMVSKPDFDPNSISDYWEYLSDSSNSSSLLLNRATQGLYPPGSTFKIITTLAYLRANNGDDDFSYNCTGSLNLDDYTIHCSSSHAHGSQNLENAFANSCNSAFAYIGTNLDPDQFTEVADSLLFNTDLPTDIENVKKSSFSLTSSTAEALVGQTAIGQGNTTVTPFHMALLAAAIANDGVLMQPYVVDSFVSANGDLVSQNDPVAYGSIMTSEEAQLLSDYMIAVTEYGTADDVDFGDLTVYGKTGTAEYIDSDKDAAHSWFVGYAKNTNGDELAIAVIMEGAGYGSKYAAPLAAAVFDAYFN